MIGRLEGKIAFISGAARGQGRAHAVRMAQEGADIIAIDLCAPVESCGAPSATEADLAETVALVEKLDRRIVARVADIRDFDQITSALDEGVDVLGRVDIVVANAGVDGVAGPAIGTSASSWSEVIDINLTGSWNTARAAAQRMIDQGGGGVILVTSSAVAFKAVQNLGAYSASKYGLRGLVTTLAVELAPHGIRVNAIHPGGVSTPLLLNENNWQIFRPDLENPQLEDVIDLYRAAHLLDIPWLEPEDIANAAVFLASDEARYITGIAMPVDGGMSLV